MNIELYFDYLLNNPESMVTGEATASQLPGRQNGGAADAYRHILISAELTRDYGAETAFEVLIDHERESTSGADNGLDMWNNSIGMAIGEYVRNEGGSWIDVVRLARSVMVSTFRSSNYNEINGWKIISADDGIRKAYSEYTKQGGTISFDNFAKDFDRSYRFRSNGAVIHLDGGKLIVESAAMTSPGNWAVNPKILVNGQWIELTIEESAFPGGEWIFGRTFVYEEGNGAPVLIFDDELGVDQCFLHSTPILLADGTTKPIEAIRPEDRVMSYDASGNLVPARVTRTFVNDVAHVLDFHGTGVTPGHVFLCGAGRFAGRHVPLIDILRDDGAVVRQDGSLMRAATGFAVGSEDDRLIAVVAADGTTGWVRAVTRLPEGAGEVTASTLVARAGVHCKATPVARRSSAPGGPSNKWFTGGTTTARSRGQSMCKRRAALA
jgi:hypothetical protein